MRRIPQILAGIAALAAAALHAPAASAQNQNPAAPALTARQVADPQAYMAGLVRACGANAADCIRAAYIDAFGAGVAQLGGLDEGLRVFQGLSTVQWTILSDTAWQDSLRYVYVQAVSADGREFYLRGQFTRFGGNWRIMHLVAEIEPHRIFIPAPAGGVSLPVTQRR